jgi:AAHS family 4-hydroxybenzoate transporter-like MFS transporter
VTSSIIDVAEVIERQKVAWFTVRLIVISWIVTFFDGFDMFAISFTAPYFATTMHLNKLMLGNIFSIGLFGAMLGGFLLGYLGDIIGRRVAIILAAFTFGVLTLCFALATSYPALLWLRLLNGIAIGGMLPLSWALNIEYVPRRFRATVVTLIMLGYSLGTSLAGPITNWLAPHFGWQAVFIFGGCATLASALLLCLWLPESIRFLAVKGLHPERIARIVRRLAPQRVVAADATFVAADERDGARSFSLPMLFHGELRSITPLLWLAYIASSLSTFFLASWGPIMFESLGFDRATAASASALNAAGGALGGLLLMRFTDNLGPRSIAIMPLIGIPLLLIAGLGNVSPAAFLALNFVLTLFLVGGHFGLHSIAGIFYPSGIRGSGAGWATSVAKVGSIAGPLLGGALLSTSLPVKNCFAVLAICPIIFSICIFCLGTIYEGTRRREALAHAY